MKSNQLGKFKIAEELIRRNPDQIFEAFQIIRVVPVRAETLFAERAIEYVAICERFAEVLPDKVCPDYNIRITVDKFGHVELVEVLALNP